MLKYLTQKLRTQSINEENNGNEKIDGHDSGTESDDGDIDPLKDEVNEHEMELSVHLRPDMTSPICVSESTFLGPPHLLTYDQNSSEEELEVINGPTNGPADTRHGWQDVRLPLVNETSPKRCSSTILEKRKRSLAHSSDDEVRQLLEQKQQQQLQQQQQISAPVNFRTSPPLEALKPHRGHMKRSTTPLVLTAETATRFSHHHHHHHHHHHQLGSVSSSGRGSLGEISQITPSNSGGNISLSPTSPLSVVSNQSKPTSPITNLAAVMGRVSTTTTPLPASSTSSTTLSSSSSKATTSTKTTTNYCDKILNCNNTNYHIENISHQQQSVVNIPMVDVSPPTKKKSRHHHPTANQRSYRPCLDFDKMQQLKNRSVTTWRHSNEHGELSVFCW